MDTPFFLYILGMEAGHSSAESLVNCRQSANCRADGEGAWVHTPTELRIAHSCLGGKRDAGEFFVLQNNGGKPVCITNFSPRNVLPLEGAAGGDLRIHFFTCCWQCEYQHHSLTFEQADVVPVSVHPAVKSFSVTSCGSYTTANYYPFLAVENLVSGKTMYMAFEPSANWRIETGLLQDGVYIAATETDERHLFTALTLRPGETYASPVYLAGTVEGGLDEAVRALIKRKRMCYGGKASPVVFNDYMNCCWTRPSRELTRRLIDAAAEAGAEVFCIDDGWQYETDEDRTNRLGDWNYSRTAFGGEEGFFGVLRYIREKGMIPGIWFELEVVGENAEIYQKPDDWFLTRRGVRVGGGARVFLDFRNPQVCDYILSKLRFYYGHGVRYIKNDYNECIGNDGEDAIGYTRAVRAFYRRVREEFPDLIMENCGSGAMRSDGGMLRIFDLQSTSDQEIAANYPSIAQGAVAMLLPEQAASWAYPYPLLNQDFFGSGRITPSTAEETAYTMLTGMCGVLYLSGRIECADAAAKALIREGVSCYKQIRGFLAGAYPVFPNGFTHIADKCSPVTVLFRKDKCKEALLYVWRQAGAEEVRIPVAAAGAEVLYPRSLPTEVSLQDGEITVRLKTPYSGRLLCLHMPNYK